MIDEKHKIDIVKATRLAERFEDALENFDEEVNIFEIATAAQLVIYLQTAIMVQKGVNDKW